jgi:xylulose-5-phosphate/fructose-6-phosphate phosphoketolase
MTQHPDDPGLAAVDAYWRAANYLSAGQLYLLANPLLREPLRREHIKSRLLGHWGTSPGINFCYAHLNRIIRARGLEMMWVLGPGHGGPAALANAWLEGTYSEMYPEVSLDEAGMARLFRQFSFPGGVPSHAAPQTPGSINEGGELGYSLAHAYGAAFDNPGLTVACIIGDGEAETGPLAASWQSSRFLDPVRDGAVLPILHLNGYKIANPSVLARIPPEDLVGMLSGYGYHPYLVSGADPQDMHRQMSSAMDSAMDEIAGMRGPARPGTRSRPPMIVLRSPKGWTGPAMVADQPVEGTWRSHQIPLADVRDDPRRLAMLEAWLQSYRPAELFTPAGAPVPGIRAAAPGGKRRLSASPHANGGLLLQPLRLPELTSYAADVPAPGADSSSPTRQLGPLLRDVIAANPGTFRIMGPDETESNGLAAVFQVTSRAWQASRLDTDENLGPGGRVMEILSEHLCQGWLEGYLLTGRHGLLNSYEAFVHIVDSMFNQHAKWLEASRQLPWRRPVAALNYLLSSHVWQQDHNGFTHQDPGFLNVVMNKKPEVVRVYLPPDSNTLLAVADHCLRSRDLVNVIVAGKQPTPGWLDLEQATAHCAAGAGTWKWASTGGGDDPDVILGCAGDVPTRETLAAADLLRRLAPGIRVRVVNVVDLMRLQDDAQHPHGLPDADFAALFPPGRPVIFAFHGYPHLIHQLTYRRAGQAELHVHGYREEGTTTTPFDMLMLNDLDRFQLAIDAIDRVPGAGRKYAAARQELDATRDRCRRYAYQHGEDAPEVTDWQWPSS